MMETRNREPIEAMDQSSTEPSAQFVQLVQTFGLQALMASGRIANPITQETEVDLALAQYHIGVLEVLQAKTQGNLTSEEEGALCECLHDARMAFVEAQSASPEPGKPPLPDPDETQPG